MKRGIILIATMVLVLIALSGCNEQPAPVQVDAPQLASSLKWLGTCGVLCSALGATGLIIASRNRRK